PGRAAALPGGRRTAPGSVSGSPGKRLAHGWPSPSTFDDLHPWTARSSTSDAGGSPACAGETAIARPKADRTGQDGRNSRLSRNLPVKPREKTYRLKPRGKTYRLGRWPAPPPPAGGSSGDGRCVSRSPAGASAGAVR